jgi:hypothetical protein
MAEAPQGATLRSCRRSPPPGATVGVGEHALPCFRCERLGSARANSRGCSVGVRPAICDFQARRGDRIDQAAFDYPHRMTREHAYHPPPTIRLTTQRSQGATGMSIAIGFTRSAATLSPRWRPSFPPLVATKRTPVTAGWLLVATKLAACVPRRGWQFEPERVNNRRIRTKPWGEKMAARGEKSWPLVASGGRSMATTGSSHGRRQGTVWRAAPGIFAWPLPTRL